MTVFSAEEIQDCAERGAEDSANTYSQKFPWDESCFMNPQNDSSRPPPPAAGAVATTADDAPFLGVVAPSSILARFISGNEIDVGGLRLSSGSSSGTCVCCVRR